MTLLRQTLFVHATNVHAGGGGTLLGALLCALPQDMDVVALLDVRMNLPESRSPNLEIRRTQPSVWKRFKAEWWLRRHVKPGDLVLCFGNLPPLFRSRGRVVVFLQNRYLIDRVSMACLPFKTRLRLTIERIWLAWKADNAYAFVVQTPSMQTLLESSGLAQDKPVYLLPFIPGNGAGYQRALLSLRGAQACDFIYVASGEPHKNHRTLVEAWCLLAREGCFPSIWLTLDSGIHTELCAWIEQQKLSRGLHIENVGVRSHDEITVLYTRVSALIYPSTFESFGMPLIEARQAGLTVIASELDFVRDVLDPEQVFDPQSPMSIARAVKRFMGAEEKPLPLLDAAEFMKHLLEMRGS